MNPQKRPEDPEALRKVVSEGYAQIAERAGSSCCGSTTDPDQLARAIGYATEQLEELPEGANLGLGCGNPTAIDALRAGEVVVDLGSGAGIDAFLAAKQVGETGRVIGVDMTDAMLERARKNARDGGYTNVEFRKGKIEDLPLDDESVDVIISNCVINLSPEKDKVYREAYRVLKPGGRMMISDVVLERELPKAILLSIDALVGCIGGASLRRDYLETIEKAGFSKIRVQGEKNYGTALSPDDPTVQRLAHERDISKDQINDLLDTVTSLQLLLEK